MDGNSNATKLSYMNIVCNHLVIETQDYPDEEEEEEEAEEAADAEPVVKRNSKSTCVNLTSCGTNLLSELKDVKPVDVKGNMPVGKGCVNPFIPVAGTQDVLFDERLGGSYARCEVERPFNFPGVMDLKVGESLTFHAGFNVYSSYDSNKTIAQGSI